jgi:ketosteroid isomerase-like protein
MEPHPFRRAIEARDLDAMIDTLAPDVVFRSPLISETFEGREQVADLFKVLSEQVLFGGDVRYMEELAEGDTAILVFSMNVRGRRVEGVDVLKHNGDGKIREITVFLGPLPGATAVAQSLSPRLAAGDNQVKAGFVGLGIRPLGALSKMFDRIGSRTVRRARARSG